MQLQPLVGFEVLHESDGGVIEDRAEAAGLDRPEGVGLGYSADRQDFRKDDRFRQPSLEIPALSGFGGKQRHDPGENAAVLGDKLGGQEQQRPASGAVARQQERQELCWKAAWWPGAGIV